VYGGDAVKWSRLVPPAALLFLFLLVPLAQSQTNVSNPAVTPACPIELLSFNPSDVTARVKNVSGKRVVGMVFNVALADATEHWKWLHWDFDQNRPLRNFGWNKALNPGSTKHLRWYLADLDFEHGAFVLTSVLFEDGSDWEAPIDGASCKLVWYNSHKRFFLKPINLPPRE
jgi:hypothetical protein